MKGNFTARYLILLLVQLLLCNYFRFTPYVMLSILPVMVLCIPTRVNTITGMLIAFATGLAVDFLAEGVVGLNTFALVPVALVRRGLVSLVFGDELIKRGENFSMRKFGPIKVIFVIFIVQTVFLLLYIWADGAAARPFSFSFWRYIASVAAGTILSIFVADVLSPHDRR